MQMYSKTIKKEPIIANIVSNPNVAIYSIGS